MKIIDKENYNYLVRKIEKNYKVFFRYGISRKSAKGYVGIKHTSEDKEFLNKDEALRYFANLKEEYVPKFYRKEFIDLFISYYPIVDYVVACPKCGEDAKILDWVMLMEYGKETENCEYHHIVCSHCAKSDYWEDKLSNVVGKCYVPIFKNEEEKEIKLIHQVGNIKWENWVNEKV